MFTNVVARWPGSTHDSHVFRTSNICTYLQDNHRSLDDGVLLGDSGYACSPFLMTPYTTTRSAAQEAYNDAHAKTRVVIEQTFGRWKRRFHVFFNITKMVAKGLQHAALNGQYWVFRYCSYSPYGTVPAKAALHSKERTVYSKISIPKNTTIDSFI